MYHARELMNSLEDIDLELYTDVMVMLSINDVKRPALKEWQVKKVSEKLVIQSYMLTWSRFKNEQHSLYVKIGKFCYKYKLFCKLFLLLLFQVAEDLCLSLQDLSRKTRVYIYWIEVPASLHSRIAYMGQVLFAPNSRKLHFSFSGLRQVC